MEKEIELFPFLKQVVEQTTTHYKEDFQIDMIALGDAVYKRDLDQRTFLWMARPLGTNLVLERDAFLRETNGHKIWTYYADMSKGIQAYRVVVNGGRKDAPVGTVHKLNYPEQVKRVMANAIHAVRIELTFADGQVYSVPVEKYREEREWITTVYGTSRLFRYCPENEYDLENVIAAERLCEKKRRAKRKSPTRTPAR